MPAQDPGHGYFLTTPLGPDALAGQGVLGIPASVFGSDWSGTVLSSLSLASPAPASRRG